MSQFEDEAAVIRAIDGYTDAINHGEISKFPEIFWPDASWGTVNFREFKFEGLPAIMEGLGGIIKAAKFFTQMRSSTIVKISGDSATARSTMHEVGDLGGSFLCYGSYSDKLAKKNGVWKFTERRFRYLYWEEGTMTGQGFPFALS